MKLLLFDWNGTLLDDVSVVYESVCEIFHSFSIDPPSLDTYRAEITADYMEFYWAHGVPKTATADDLNDIRSRVLRERWDDVRLNEGAVGALNALKNRGWTFGILSAEIPEVLDGRLDQFDIRHHFEVVRGGAWPKETAFKEVLASFPSASRRCYVDDTFDGLSSAVAMGLEPIGFTGGYNTKERILEVTDECIDSLRQLIDLLN